MDIVNQNKFKNFLLIFLLAVNIITVSVIWFQTSKGALPQQSVQEPKPKESVDLMKQELSLNDEQTGKLEKIRSVQLNRIKYFNDMLDKAKLQLAEELFKEKPDTIIAASKTKEIGELQAKLESFRFYHFYSLLSICTPEQKEKMKPVIMDVFNRKQAIRIQQDKKPLGEAKNSSLNQESGDRGKDEKPAPPSIDEKLEKYSKRLDLSNEQRKKVKDILQLSRQKGEGLKKKEKPDPGYIETEKEKNKKDEDAAIMKILDERQKKEFEKMLLKRNK